MTDIAALVERLRRFKNWTAYGRLMMEAADALEALQARIEHQADLVEAAEARAEKAEHALKDAG